MITVSTTKLGERMRAMSNTDYEMAWKRLKEKLLDRSLSYVYFIQSPINDAASKRRVRINLSIVDMVFAEMDLIEKEMTTINEGRSEK